MSFEEEFDKIIRRKAEEEHYPFDQNNWDKTSSLLDAERKVAAVHKFKKLYLPFALTVIIGSAGFVAHSLFSSSEDTKNIAVVSQNNLPAPGGTDLKEALSTGNDRISEISAEQVTEASARTSVPAQDITETKPKADSPENLADKVINPTSPEIVIPENKQVNAGSDKATVATYVGKNDLNGTFSADDTPGLAKTGAISGTEGSDSQNNLNTPSSDNDKAAAGQPEEHSAETKDKELAKEDSNDQVNDGSFVTGEELVNTEDLTSIRSFIPFELIEADVTLSPFVFLQRYDDEYYKNANAKKHYMNVEAGAAYLLGWQAKNNKDGQGFDWYAGLNYGRYLSKKISFGFGIQAYTIANIKQPFYQISQKEYGFGSQNIYTKVTTTQLYYVALPLKINYALNPSNEIGLGFNAAYLTNAKSTVSKYYILDGEEKRINEGSGNTNTIYKGTNTVNLMLTAHYKASLNKRTALNVEFNYGITDIFSNMGEIRTSERPVGIRLGLNYTLFDK